MENKKGELRVFYSDRVPINKAVYFKVKSISEAKKVMNILTKRDLADERITDNLLSLQVFSGEDWEDWENEDGQSFDELEESGEAKTNLKDEIN